MRLLLLEDDEMLGEGLRDYLGADGHVVDWCRSLGDTQALRGEPFDALLVDWQLPDGSGLDWLRARRARGDRTPALMLTARDRLVQRIEGLDAGADDYLVKPFGSEQLAARMRAVLRRSGPATVDAAVRVGDLEIDPAARRVTIGGEPVELSRKEFDLLWLLASRPGEVITKRDMLAEVWGLPFGGGDRTIDVHLSWLRRKLGETAAEPRYLHTVRGVGVRLAPPGDVS